MASIHRTGNRPLIAVVLGTVLFIGQSRDSQAQDPGEQVFQTTCFACHTIGAGRLVGPDLAGVHERRSQEWLERFVKSSQSMVSEGDADATALFEEFNRMPMPDAVVSDEQIRQVLDYIKAKGPAATPDTDVDTDADADTGAAEKAAAEESVAIEQSSSEEDILIGQDLFQGKIRFANSGPACNACHEVRHDAVIAGGILATELTSVFSRMGGAGVKAILGRAPFPVMQAAYKNHSLTEQEVAALVAFLEYADSEQYNQLPRDYGIGLFLSGAVGASVLFGFFGFVWRGRKKGSVYQSIFDRQISSVSDNQD